MKFKFKKLHAFVLCGVLCAATVTPLLSEASSASPKVSLTTNISGGISQSYVIEPENNSGSVSLDDLTLRYYYEKDENKEQSFTCDTAGLSMNVAPYYQDISKYVNGSFSENYLEITFSGNQVIENGRLNLGIRFNQNDWSSYTNFNEIKLDVIYEGIVIDSKVYDDSKKDVTPSEPTQPSESVQPTEPAQPTQPEKPAVITAQIADGWYYVKSVSAQKYLSVTANNASAGANVEIYAGNGASAQKWQVTNTTDGYITLKNGLGNFMLDVTNGANEDGANMIIYNAYSGDAQKYILKTTGTNGVYSIATKVSNQTKALDVYQNKTANGTNVCQWLYNGNANQQWIFEPTTAPSAQPQPSTPTNPSTPETGCILPKCDVDKDGPFAVTVEYNVGPNGKGMLVRPANLGTNGVAKHPVFIWNPGGGDQPSLYLSQMKRWASQGFVVYSEESQWSGKQCPDALNWICQQNENSRSSLYNKLDLSRIAAGGFSLGSVGAYEVASDPRIVTTIHCDGGSFDGSGSGKWKKPTCVMNGLNDGGLAVNNTNRDYANAKVPIWYGGIIGGGHGSTVWDGGDAITGWLRWQLAGDDLSYMFLTPNGKFNTGVFKSQWKNWP